MLIVEAKSGSIQRRQHNEYTRLIPADINSKLISSVPASLLNIEICYACSDANLPLFYAERFTNGFSFPLLVFDGMSIKRDPSFPHFSNQTLENTFSGVGIRFNHPPPNTYYPFSDEDSLYVKARVIIESISQYDAGQEFTPEELMGIAHPTYGQFG